MFTEICYEVDGPAAVVTLDRPEQLNAFTGTMLGELLEAFDRADADDAVRAVIVTGAGRAFCAGADLAPAARRSTSKPAAVTARRRAAPRDGGGILTLRIFECTKPVIARDQRVGRRRRHLDDPADGHPSPRRPRQGRFRLRRPGHRPGRRGELVPPARSWASTRRWSGSSPPACSAPRRRSTAGSCAASTRPARCSTSPRGWPRRSPPTPRPCRPPSAAACCGGCSARRTRWRPTAPTRRRSSTSAANRTRARAWSPSSRSGAPSWTLSPTRDLPASYPWWDNPTYEGE